MAVMPQAVIVGIEAIRLEPGGIYVIEAQQRFRTNEEYERCSRELTAVGEKYGCKFVLLDFGLKIARQEIAK